jgi:hypothetical protein
MLLTRPRGADLEHHRGFGSAILQMMAVGAAGLEAGAVAGLENCLPRVGDERDGAAKDVNEFVDLGMPMPLA